MAEKEAASANQEAKQVINVFRPPRPRSVVIDGLVFVSGVGALLWVLCNMAPS